RHPATTEDDRRAWRRPQASHSPAQGNRARRVAAVYAERGVVYRGHGETVSPVTQKMLSEASRAEIAAHFAKYPTKRSAIIPALYISQREQGWLTEDAIDGDAHLLEHHRTEVRSV